MRAVPRHLQLRVAVAIFLVIATAACQPGGGRPNGRPTVTNVQAGLHCGSGDHGYNDPQFGWGFCYPGTWRFSERLQASQKPIGTDSAFNVVNAPPCASPAQRGGEPQCPPDAGLFAFMVVGTYERGTSTDLADWLSAEEPADTDTEAITWGNASEAVQVKGTTRRYALTQHQVVLLDLRSGAGNLDLEAEMSKRLASWNFSF
jgi:hypothetical protein